MQITVGEDDKAAILRPGIFAGLLFANQRALVLRFRFKNDEREALFVEQEEVDEAQLGLFEVLAEIVEVMLTEFDRLFEPNIRGLTALRKEPPASRFQKIVDFDPRRRFFHRFVGSECPCP